MSWTLRRLAERVGGRIEGDPERVVLRVRTLEAAGPEDLSFLTSMSYQEQARASRAGAIVVDREVPGLDCDRVVVADARVALAGILELMHPEPVAAAGVHATAVLGEGAEIGVGAHVGPYAVIGERTRIGARARIHAHVVVGPDCDVGEDAVLHPHVVLYRRTRVGARTIVHAGVVLGADGFGFASEGQDLRKVPQIGDVEVGSDVEIGALSAVDRALVDTTRVGDGTKIDNLVQVGHNVVLGRGVILCGQVGIAGSSRIGDGAILGGQAGVGDHLDVGDGARVASKSAVYTEVGPGRTVAGIPAVEIGDWRRQQALGKRLAELWRRLRSIEKKVGGGAGEDGGDGT